MCSALPFIRTLFILTTYNIELNATSARIGMSCVNGINTGYDARMEPSALESAVSVHQCTSVLCLDLREKLIWG